MELNNWNRNTAKVTEWLRETKQGNSDNVQAITLSITLGNNCDSDDLRSTYWTAIRSIGSTLQDFPMNLGRKTRRSKSTLEQSFLNELSTILGLTYQTCAKKVQPILSVSPENNTLKHLKLNVNMSEHRPDLIERVEKLSKEYQIGEINIFTYREGRTGFHERTGKTYGASNTGNRIEPGY